MAVSEEELAAKFAEADKEWQLSKKRLADAKNKLMAAESLVLEQKMIRDQCEEALRMFIAHSPKHDPTLAELEIKRFQETYPELCAMAKQRDENKS